MLIKVNLIVWILHSSMEVAVAKSKMDLRCGLSLQSGPVLSQDPFLGACDNRAANSRLGRQDAVGFPHPKVSSSDFSGIPSSFAYLGVALSMRASP